MAGQPNIVFLDAPTVDLGDIDTKALQRLGNFVAHANCLEEELVTKAGDAAIIITNKCYLHERHFARLPRLKLVCAAATGTNHIDLEGARRRGVGVTNVPGYSTASVAEHSILFVLALSHRLIEHHASAWDGRWSRSPHFAVLNFPFRGVAGKTLGIIGYGAIGRHVARLARALEMKIVVARLPGRRHPPRPVRAALGEVLRRSDFVVIHSALSKTTCGLLDATRLAAMKPTAFLINMARGPIVCEEDVARALRTGGLAGYGTDVLSVEPPPADHPLFAADLKDKVLLTPHVAWASVESRQRMISEIAANIQAFLKGKRRNRVA